MAEITKPITEEDQIPTAKVEIKPPKFMIPNRVPLSPKEEYDEVKKAIEEGRNNNRIAIIIAHDLQDYAWQKLSQEGFKLKREVLPRLIPNPKVQACELDTNRVQFTISLTEFNRIDI